MSAAEVMAPVDADHAEPTLVATDAMEEPAVVEEEDDEDETLVFKARGKRSRPQADSKGGAADASDDVSPRGPIDASQADSPPKSSDDEDDANENDGMKLPGKKKLKLRTKGAAEEAAKSMYEHNSELEDSDPEDDAGDVVYDEDDEEGMLEMRMREKGTLSEDEDEEAPAEEEEESEESDLEDSEDDFDLEEELATKKPRRAATPAAPAPIPENETAEEKEARMAKEKAETQAAQQEIMREASRRARLTGYHVAPDRDPFAYRKVFAHVAACVERLNLPKPPPDPVFEEEPNPFDGEDASGEEASDEEEAEYDSQAEDEEREGGEGAAPTVELELEDGDEDGLNDQEDLGLDDDEVAAMMAAVKPKAKAPELDVSEEAAAKELAAQKAAEASENAAPEESEDDLSEEEAHEMTRKERLRQLKRAKAFFKKDAAAQQKIGEAFEDEAEMSEDGGHTSDEEEVEIEENGDGTDRIIKRRVAKRADGLLDREELEEMVDYIDFNDTADDDERRAAKRAAAHARFEEERDEEELRKMQEALKNGFRRPNKNGALGEDGPDYWQRRRRNGGEESDEDDDLGIDIPDRAWEAVVLSSDDDGEWAERAARRRAVAAADAKKATTESAPDGVQEDSRVPAARDFASQDFKSMIDAGKQRRKKRVQRGTAAAAAAMETNAPSGAFPAPPPAMHRTNSAGTRLNPVVGPRGLERQASTSFLGRGNSSKSNPGGGGLIRSASLGAGGASRSFVFGGGGDSQSMWEKDAEENGRANPPTVLTELGGSDNARTDFGWAPREKTHPAKPSTGAVPSRLGGAGGSGKSLFGMLQASQDWDEVLGRSDSLAEGVKAANKIKLRPAVQR